MKKLFLFLLFTVSYAHAAPTKQVTQNQTRIVVGNAISNTTGADISQTVQGGDNSCIAFAKSFSALYNGSKFVCEDDHGVTLFSIECTDPVHTVKFDTTGLHKVDTPSICKFIK